MESGRSAEVDRTLEGLGSVPSNLLGLVEQYAGRARLTPSDADSLLAELAQRDQVARTLVGGVAAPDQRAVGEDRELSARLVRPGESDHVEAERDQLGPALTQAESGQAESDQVKVRLETDQVGEQSPASDSRDGPPTRRMDARDVRVGPGGRKAAFSAGLLGADDLPDFPVIRSPSAGKDTEAQTSAAPTAASSTLSDQTDSFEILVDEEILEIEPDDAVFDDSPDES